MEELIGDIAKSLGWVYKNIARYGGDPKRDSGVICETHRLAFPYWVRAQADSAEGKAPFLLVHVDAHPDFSPPRLAADEIRRIAFKTCDEKIKLTPRRNFVRW